MTSREKGEIDRLMIEDMMLYCSTLFIITIWYSLEPVELHGHEGTIRHVAWLKAHNVIISGSEDKTLR